VARTTEDFAEAGIDVHLNTRVTEIRISEKTVALENGDSLPFDDLVVATGAVPQSLGVSGENLPGIFSLRNLTDAVRIKRFIAERRAKRAVLLGAGFVSLEMCEALKELDMAVTVVDLSSLPMPRLGEDFGQIILGELQRHDVRFMADTTVTDFEASSKGEIGVHTDNGSLEADLVLVAIGIRPQVSPAADAGIDLGPTGAIAVDEHMRTNIPFVYAAGDCCESYHRISGKPVHYPLGDIANKQGRVAGANIGGQNLTFPGVVGSNCFKVFDLEVADTGLTEQEARDAGFNPTTATIKSDSKPSSYPGAAKLWLRMTADRDSGRLLGAQAVGGDGVVSRVNILAAALTANLPVQELAYIDLAYAPPFSGAWDPIHIAAQQLLK
jgi:NADPH-dependent 2,4-dienoyl-CoA reductase/sulfur reductase-like enzyme